MINMCNVFEFIKDKNYDEIKKKSENVKNLVVKDTMDLYLLANASEVTSTRYTRCEATDVVTNNEANECEATTNDVATDVVTNNEANECEATTNDVATDVVTNNEANECEATTNDVATNNESTNVEQLLQQANGVIFEKDTNNVVAMCQNKLQDIYDYTKAEMLIQENLNVGNNVRIEYCEDGTLMRLYNYNDTWNVATTKCIDAKRSYWSSNRSFDSMFWEIFDKSLLQTLDKDFTYLFVLLHKENRIVVRHKVNMLVYISRINNKTLVEDYLNQFKNIYGIKRPKVLDVNEIDFRSMFNPYKRGILIKIFDKTCDTWNIYKLDFENYRLVKRIRGNVPEIRMRFLDLLKDPEALALLERFYSEYHFMFMMIKSDLMKLVKTVHRLYIESHVKHSVVVEEDNMFFRTMKQLHAQYKTTNKPITFDEVRIKLFNLDKHVIKRFLNWS